MIDMAQADRTMRTQETTPDDSVFNRFKQRLEQLTNETLEEPDMKKKFIAYWGIGYGNPQTEILEGLDYFSDSNNYTEEVRESLDQLELLGSLDLSEFCGAHYVIRIE